MSTIPAHARPPRTPRPAPAPRTDSPRIARLERDAARRGDGAVRRFWDEVGPAGSPLIEPGGPGTVIATFLWQGAAGTPGVLAAVNKLFDRADPAASLMRRVPGTDVWSLSYRLPADWRGSYRVYPGAPGTGGHARGGGPVVRDQAARDQVAGDQVAADPAARDRLARDLLAAEPVPDPRNPAILPQAGGAPPKSVAAMPAAPDDAHLRPGPEVPRGITETLRVPGPGPGETRRVRVHVPPGPEPAGGHRLLVLLDGDIWTDTVPLLPALDALTAAGVIPPMLTAAVDGAGAAARARDMTCHGPYARFLAEELPAAVAGRHRITADPARTIIAGQSLGGLAAGFAAHRYPGRFGAVLMQSPSLWWRGGEASAGVHPAGGGDGLAGVYAAGGGVPRRIALQVGTDEWVNLAPARRFRDTARRRGVEVAWQPFSGGHDRACWRVGIAAGLSALVGGR